MEEITADYSVEELSLPTELKVIPRATVACKSDLGRVRENNEDKFEFFVSEQEAMQARRGAVYVVCDGMGGAEAGQIASELTAKTFIDVYLHHPSHDAEVAMEAAVFAANRFVMDVGRAVPSRKGMGTTLSSVILLQDKAYIVQVGDSRVYRLRDGVLLRMTKDHTWIEEAIEAGIVQPSEIDTHPYRHVITRAISTEGEVKPDIFKHDLQVGDIFMICSDGLTNHVQDETICEVLNENMPPEAVWKLVGLALQGGGTDNTTVIVLRVDELITPAYQANEFEDSYRVK